MCEACLDRCLGAYRIMYVLRYYRAECALRFMAKIHIVVQSPKQRDGLDGASEGEHLYTSRGHSPYAN